MQVHSYLSPKCEARKSNLDRQGVFAIEEIDKGEVVTVWGGKIYYFPDLKENNNEVTARIIELAVQVHENFILGPTDLNHLDDVEYMNHSCDPNVGITGTIMLIARRKIRLGEEICFDYETTHLDIIKPFNCKCGHSNCRGYIDGNAWKCPAFQARNRNYFSAFAEKRIADFRRLKRMK